MLYLRAGSSLLFEVQVSDIPAYGPIVPTSITITLFDKHGTIVANNIAMQSTVDIGYYTYLFRSHIFMLNGPYRLVLRSMLASQSVITHELIAFVLTDGIKDDTGTIVVLPDHFDYIIIKDAANTLWYWSIVSTSVDSSDALYTLSTTLPTDAFLRAHDITPSPIPYGLAVLDELGSTKYIYPDTLGQVTVDTTQPVGSIYNVGAGLDMIGRDRITYRYSALSYLSAILTPILYPPL